MKKLIPLFFLALLLTSVVRATPTNNALYFDADARVTGLSGVSPSAFTLEFWVFLGYTGTPASEGGVYWDDNGGDERGVFIEPDHTIFFYTQTDAILTAGAALPTNTWVHVAYSYDGTTMKIYVNAALRNTVTMPGILLPMTSVKMGYSATGGNGDYDLANTIIDEVRIWNFAKTQTQILNGKAHTLTLPQAGLQRYYSFNQGVAGANNSAVTTLPEMTGNGTSGTLTGFTLNGTSSNWVSNTPFTLPLELLSFKAITSGSEIKTSWTTANEIQVSGFEVERSGDGVSFEKESTVVAHNKQANSYEWADISPLSGNNYYRLKMIDIDGNATFSKVVMADLTSNTNVVKIYAGAGGTARAFTVEISSQAPKGNYNVGVYNMSGAMIYRRQWQHNGSATAQAIVLPSSVATGVYTIIVSDGSQRFTQRWVVE